MAEPKLVDYIEDIATYSPPLHSGTVNRRLVPAELGAGFELVHGTLAPGGNASPHYHPTEWQVIPLIEGEGQLVLGDSEPVVIRAGAVIRIPPATPHIFDVLGDRPAKVFVLYCPPLGPDSFRPAV